MKKKILLPFLLGLIIVSGYAQVYDSLLNSEIRLAESREASAEYEEAISSYLRVISYCEITNKDNPDKYYPKVIESMKLYLKQLLEASSVSKNEKIDFIDWKLFIIKTEWANTSEIKELVLQIDKKLWS